MILEHFRRQAKNINHINIDDIAGSKAFLEICAAALQGQSARSSNCSKVLSTGAGSHKPLVSITKRSSVIPVETLQQRLKR